VRNLEQMMPELTETMPPYNIDEISQSLIERFLQMKRQKEEASQNTLARHLAGLRKFCQFLKEKGYLSLDPIMQIEVKQHKKVPYVISTQQIDEMVAACSGKFQKRDKALILFLYDSGLRISEAILLSHQDINWEEKYLIISWGKRNKQRYVPTSDLALSTLEQHYREELNLDILKERGPVFRNRYGKKLSKRRAQKIVTNAARTAGIRQPVSAHTLRHSYATHLLHRGANLRTIQILLGHEQIQTTQIYTHVTSPMLKEIYQKAHPHSRLNLENVNSKDEKSSTIGE